MAIDTTNKKLALMEWDVVCEPGLPVSPGTLGQDDKQQLVWGYPGILWNDVLVSIIQSIRLRGIYNLSVELRGSTGDG